MGAGAAEINQHQGLFLVYGGMAFAVAFEAALVDKPSGGEFGLTARLGVYRQGGVPLFQRGGLFGGNDGVFIEAAAAAGFGGVGQLAAADAAHGFGHDGSGERRALS